MSQREDLEFPSLASPALRGYTQDLSCELGPGGIAGVRDFAVILSPLQRQLSVPVAVWENFSLEGAGVVLSQVRSLQLGLQALVSISSGRCTPNQDHRFRT